MPTKPHVHHLQAMRIVHVRPNTSPSAMNRLTFCFIILLIVVNFGYFTYRYGLKSTENVNALSRDNVDNVNAELRFNTYESHTTLEDEIHSAKNVDVVGEESESKNRENIENDDMLGIGNIEVADTTEIYTAEAKDDDKDKTKTEEADTEEAGTEEADTEEAATTGESDDLVEDDNEDITDDTYFTSDADSILANIAGLKEDIQAEHELGEETILLSTTESTESAANTTTSAVYVDK